MRNVKGNSSCLCELCGKIYYMNTLLWIGQVFLAIVFIFSGSNKAVLSEKQLIAKGQTGVVGLPAIAIRFIGIIEVLGAIGIIVPWWTGIWRVLTPVTAICFAVIMMLAAPIHYKLKEPKNVATNLTIMIVAILVAWGRAQQMA